MTDHAVPPASPPAVPPASSPAVPPASSPATNPETSLVKPKPAIPFTCWRVNGNKASLVRFPAEEEAFLANLMRPAKEV